MFRISFRGTSIFCVAAASGKGSFRGFSFGNTVLTMKKMSSRNAMSASDESGMSLAAFDLRFSPPWIIARHSRIWREIRSAPAPCSSSSTLIICRYGASGSVFTAAIRFGLFAASYRQMPSSSLCLTVRTCGLSPYRMSTRPSARTTMWRMFFCDTSTWFCGSGSTMGSPRSSSKTVVTRKKMSSRNAMSAIEEVGIAPLALFLSRMIAISPPTSVGSPRLDGGTRPSGRREAHAAPMLDVPRQVQHRRGALLHVHDQRVDLHHEVVVRDVHGNGDDQPRRGRDQRDLDPPGDERRLHLPGQRDRAERIDHPRDRAEEAHERRHVRHRREDHEPALEEAELDRARGAN